MGLTKYKTYKITSKTPLSDNLVFESMCNDLADYYESFGYENIPVISGQITDEERKYDSEHPLIIMADSVMDLNAPRVVMCTTGSKY
jgi:hypothetical protein